jgi:hypothetical protein
VVDALTEEEVDLKICRCCPWVKWIRFCNGWVCDLGLEIWYYGWVCDLGLENFSKFVLVGGFAIRGNSEMAKRVIL